MIALMKTNGWGVIASAGVVWLALSCTTDSSECDEQLARLKAERSEMVDELIDLRRKVAEGPNQVETNSATTKGTTSSKGRWQVKKSVSEMDESETITLWLDADTTYSDWLEQTIRPGLLVRCQNNKTYLAIKLGRLEWLGGDIGRHTVRLRIDDGKAFKAYGSASTSGEALFLRRAIPTIKKLLDARELRVEFVPAEKGDTVAKFTLAGLADHIPGVRRVCNW